VEWGDRFNSIFNISRSSLRAQIGWDFQRGLKIPFLVASGVHPPIAKWIVDWRLKNFALRFF